jgi:hypothetical protein
MQVLLYRPTVKTNFHSFQVTGRPFKHVIVTLDPNKFAEKKQQRLHIGNITGFFPRISLLKQSSLVEVPVLDYGRGFRTDGWKRFLYPPDTNAFLYYSMSPEKPRNARIAGELRLPGPSYIK